MTMVVLMATFWRRVLRDPAPNCWRFLCLTTEQMLRALALHLPARRLTKAEVIFLAFVSVQALDGVMSYVGVKTFGSWIEANPLVAWYAAMLGPAVAFTAVKLFAVACGAILYMKARHRTVAALTLFYLAFAVVPWAHLLGTYRNV